MFRQTRVKRTGTIGTLAAVLAIGLLAVTALHALPHGTDSTSNTAVAPGESGPLPGADAGAVISTYQACETELQLQLAAVVQAREEREAAYADQLMQLAARKAAVENARDLAKNRATALTEEIGTLAAARMAQTATIEQQLSQAQTTYESRYAEMSNRLTDINAKLAEAGALLGR